MIDSNLGKTLKNFEDTYEDIKEKCNHGIVLFLDEFDRFVVNRSSDTELSELKRVLISLMDFFQSISVSQKITIIATTNHIEQIDLAMQRRFSFIEEIVSDENEKKSFLNQYISLAGKNKIDIDKLLELKTISEIKKKLRVIYLDSIE